MDADGDGYPAPLDCDDLDPHTYPGAPEMCDGIVNRCYGGLYPSEADVDGDGVPLCAGDCNDGDATRYPGAAELCDGLDNDCDGELPVSELDRDQDGFLACAGDSPDTGDCDDEDPDVFPGAEEQCNGLDDDCDGAIPADEANADGDPFRICAGDCDDADPAIHPWAPELCNGIDDDCDPATDEGVDGDGDGFAVCAGDCDDGRADVFPDAVEVCHDGLDNDCDGLPGACPLVGTIALGSLPVRLIGSAAGELLGAGIAHTVAGDLDGDGLDDVLVDASGNDDGRVGWMLRRPGPGAGLAQAAASWHDRALPEDDDRRRVAMAGDVDGDGVDDVLVGTPDESRWAYLAGAAFVFLGPFQGERSLAAADATLLGEDGVDHAGTSVSAAGDVNGDGFGDLLIGARYAGASHEGVGYLVQGPVVGTMGLEFADARLAGEEYGDQAGSQVASAGDVNGDGLDDVLIAADGYGDVESFHAQGAVYLIHGPADHVHRLDEADARLYGEDAGDEAGFAIAGAGDVNGDGFDDVLVGAPHRDPDGRDGAGMVYLLHGPLGPATTLADADVVLLGEVEGDAAGWSVASAGDVDGDGLDDVLVGALRNADAGLDAGKVYLLYGALAGVIPLQDSDLQLVGGPGDRAGGSLAGAGDLDGDGFDDFLVAAPHDAEGGEDAGAVHVVYGGGPRDARAAGEARTRGVD